MTGVRIGLGGWQRDGASSDTEELLALMRRADELGFDSAWFNELHFRRVGLPYPSATLLAAAVLARTERLRVGLSVVILTIHHPLLAAEELAQLDRQGGGRLDVGIGRGFPAGLGQVFPMSDAERRDRFREAFDVLIAAWTGGSVSSNGPYWPFGLTEVGPPPAQWPHPPLFLAGTSEETMRFAVEQNLPLLLSLEPPEGQQLQNLTQASQLVGRAPNLAASSLARYVCIAPTRAEALADAERLRILLHDRRRSFAQERNEDPDSLVPRTMHDFLGQQAIVGSPDDCIAQIHELSTRLGVGHFRCTFNGNGVVDPAATLRGMELFGREVLPCFHDRPGGGTPVRTPLGSVSLP